MYRQLDPGQGGDSPLLLHDVNGSLVRVLQDGGNPNMTVYDWSQNATRTIFLEFVDKAIESGITSFFLDKASVSTSGKGGICNHICDQLTRAKARAWTMGHQEIVREVATRSTGPTIGNGGESLLKVMGGSHVSGAATKAGIESLMAMQASNYTSAIGAAFPFTRDGYAAFLVAYEPGRSFMWAYTRGGAGSLWIEEFDHNLGAPTTTAVLDEAGVYRRNFTHALVSFNTHSNTGAFSYGKLFLHTL
jgi:hypothetical protein